MANKYERWEELNSQESWLEYVELQHTLPFSVAKELLEVCEETVRYMLVVDIKDMVAGPEMIAMLKSVVAKAQGKEKL